MTNTSLQRIDDKDAEARFKKWCREHRFITFKKKLKKAAMEGNIDVLKRLLTKSTDQQLKYIVCEAMDSRETTILSTLLAAGMNPNITTGLINKPLLCCAIWRERPNHVQMLLEHGADIHKKDPIERTAIHYAAGERSDKMLNMIIEAGGDINSRDWSGETPLMQAMYDSRYATAECLLKAGAQTDIVDDDGHNALHHAINNKAYNVIKLLKQYEAQPKALPVPAQPDDPQNCWRFITDNEARIAIQLLAEPGTQTHIRHVFDFNARIRFTQISMHGDFAAATQSERSFADLDPDHLKAVQEKFRAAEKSTAPKKQNIKLT